MSEPPPDPSFTLRHFPHLLASLERGELANDLGIAIRDLVAALNDAHANGAKAPSGSLTLTLNLRLEDGAVDIKAEHKTKAPKRARGRTVLWVTPENNLTAANPRQQTMSFTAVPGRADTVRAI